ncbi:hypothetical protein PQ478_16115 [Alkalihalophilus pseudofirmus]|uniref:hypothetical protein n=1 Tax=Alkalihalophilus pseudofirmus TaxID=79885 RepID=UPI00259BAAF4|nr:hypothetical protein [Alkalihalophilus pseudofirmus]WEG16021.1 hypothetical protein PQ478_16115 [Alkalihalophilus pseudofirmus]
MVDLIYDKTYNTAFTYFGKINYLFTYSFTLNRPVVSLEHRIVLTLSSGFILEVEPSLCEVGFN